MLFKWNGSDIFTWEEKKLAVSEKMTFKCLKTDEKIRKIIKISFEKFNRKWKDDEIKPM